MKLRSSRLRYGVVLFILSRSVLILYCQGKILIFLALFINIFQITVTCLLVSKTAVFQTPS